MPSVVDKASQFSLQQKRHAFTNRYLSGKKRFTKLCHQFNFTSLIQYRRLGYQRSDMPQQDSEEQVFVTRIKSSSVSPELTQKHRSQQTYSSGGPHKQQVSKDQESGQGLGGSPAFQRGQAKLSTTRRRSEAVDKCEKLLNVPLPTNGERQAADLNQSDVEPTNPSAAYLGYCINKELRRRKQTIVDNLMAAISECVERRLEALEEECDHTSGSNSSSRAVQAGRQVSPSAGQKRSKGQRGRDESENEDEDDGNSRRKKDNKRTKTTKDDTRPRFACPYHQRDPKRFGTERTCCGPGWLEIGRVKEHLERRHSLPLHQCHRCLRRFGEEKDLKKHLRAEIPCPVKEAISLQRDLSDGYDEEQAKKLKARARMSPADKWREWYCVLFDVKTGSSEIPSPYYDPSSLASKAPCIKVENPEQWRDYWIRAKPAIQHQVAMVVENAFIDWEPRIKFSVMERLQELPRILANQLPPFPGLSSEETSTAADDLGFFSYLDSLVSEDYGDESFDFQALDDGAALNDSSALDMVESSDSSDAYQAGDSSATSVGDDTMYQQFDKTYKMVYPTILYLTLSLALLIIAIIVHVRSSNLSLAISPTLSIITIILPIFGFLNTTVYPRLSHRAKSSSSGVAQLAPLIVQVLQALVITILATRLLERAMPSEMMECRLDTKWMNMFRAHDASSIRRIQDAFDCCGLNTIRDRAYPFPGMRPSNCDETYGRRTACREPWAGALQKLSLLDLAVVLGVGLVQVLGLLLTKSNSNWWNTWGNHDRRQTSQHRESRRPLLIDRERDITEEEEAAPEWPQTVPQGYGSVNDNEPDPRVVPSSVIERNNWTED
ncbi:hypothetical protein F53441_7547 [Fusarium austroafricanum]|uniref:C2H2-type domain-containing protein n=1 Tax=Fusarium austroafricanum TaxID=2364996 RepID=A0A8H4KFG8_9HYPO|nr:hypothetical protein F53441_7547 [Fusarium austroafricanum]